MVFFERKEWYFLPNLKNDRSRSFCRSKVIAHMTIYFAHNFQCHFLDKDDDFENFKIYPHLHFLSNRLRSRTFSKFSLRTNLEQTARIIIYIYTWNHSFTRRLEFKKLVRNRVNENATENRIGADLWPAISSAMINFLSIIKICRISLCSFKKHDRPPRDPLPPWLDVAL